MPLGDAGDAHLDIDRRGCAESIAVRKDRS
jgi:hypothetical protein